MWSPVSSEQWTRLHSQLVKGDSEAQPVNSELIPIRSHFGTGLPALQLSVALWCDVQGQILAEMQPPHSFVQTFEGQVCGALFFELSWTMFVDAINVPLAQYAQNAEW